MEEGRSSFKEISYIHAEAYAAGELKATVHWRLVG